jgi:hypothetical protein
MKEDQFQELHTTIKELRDQLKEFAATTDEPKCAALCETASEVIGGLEEAFDHYLEKSETAWQ